MHGWVHGCPLQLLLQNTMSALVPSQPVCMEMNGSCSDEPQRSRYRKPSTGAQYEYQASTLGAEKFPQGLAPSMPASRRVPVSVARWVYKAKGGWPMNVAFVQSSL